MQNKKTTLAVLFILFLVCTSVLFISKKIFTSQTSNQIQQQTTQQNVSNSDFTTRVRELFDTSDMVLEGTLMQINPDTATLTVKQMDDAEKVHAIQYDPSTTLFFQQPTSVNQNVIAPIELSELQQGEIVLIYAKTQIQPNLMAHGVGVRVTPRIQRDTMVAPEGFGGGQ